MLSHMEKVNLGNEGVVRSVSDSPPTHYSVEIQSFSFLSEKFSENGYESKEFKAGGYKWKLVFHPKGNKKRNNVSAQNKGKYLVLEDAFTRNTCIHGAMRTVGFDKLIPLEEFTDVSNGFLVDDTCVFGAEVFVCKERRTGKGECLTRVKAPSVNKRVFKVEKISKLGAEGYWSEQFTAGGYNWKIKFYPDGDSRGKGSHLSLYLEFAGPPGSEVFVNFKLGFQDQIHQKPHPKSRSGQEWFSDKIKSWGWTEFMTQETFRQKGQGLLKNDACLVEVEVTILAISKAL